MLRNVAFFGTGCQEGLGKAVVVRIGDKTAIGCISIATSTGVKPETLMKIEIENFVHKISYIAVGIGVVFFIIAVSSGYGILEAMVFTIGIIVANVPEGLLATVTVALTITSLRMAAKHVLVKNCETVETLGSITVIASDKTGTLTQNRMTVRHAILNSRHVQPLQHHREVSFTAADLKRNFDARNSDARNSYQRNSEQGMDVKQWYLDIHPVSESSISTRTMSA